jgi:hypothetical protein
MGFFSRKEENKIQIQELTSSPRLPELPQLPPLPPENRKVETSNKTPLTNDQFDIHNTLPEEKRTLELSDIRDANISRFSPPPSSNASSIPPTRNFSKEPLFIKIDKFQDAIEKFDEVKKKVLDIEESLKKLNDIKIKEDEELRAWENEIRTIKEKVASIDNSLFNKL